MRRLSRATESSLIRDLNSGPLVYKTSALTPEFMRYGFLLGFGINGEEAMLLVLCYLVATCFVNLR